MFVRFILPDIRHLYEMLKKIAAFTANVSKCLFSTYIICLPVNCSLVCQPLKLLCCLSELTVNQMGP